MFKPVSFNVIRQALSWEGFPKPNAIRMLSAYKWPDGSTSAEVTLSWDGATVMRKADCTSLYDGSAAYVQFINDLRECFCSDIHPVQAHYEVGADRMTVELYCRCSSHDAEQLPLPLEN